VIERDIQSELPAAARDARLPRWLEVLGVLVILLELIAPFVSSTFGTDGPSQVYLAERFSDLLAKGVLFPTWLPEGFSGHGSPSFYFYPPGAFYLAAVVRFATGIASPERLFHATALVATLASILTARQLLRQFSASRYRLLIGSLIYAFGPYRIAELYSRSSLSSHVGYAILPLVWYGVLKVVTADRLSARRYSVLLGLSSAALVLTSVPLALLTAVTAAVAGIVWHRHLRAIRVWTRLLVAGVLAAALSAFHFVRVIEYGNDAQLNVLVQEARYVILDLLQLQSFAVAYHVAICYATIAIVAWVYWKYRESLSTTERAVSITLLGLTPLLLFLETPYLSLPVWRYVKIISLIQGVWRFYIDVLLLAACVVAAATTVRMTRAANLITGVLILGAVLPAILVVTSYHIGPHYAPRPGDPLEYLPARASEASIPLPRRVAVDPPLDASESVRVGASGPIDIRVAAHLERAHTIHLPTFYWRAWHAHEGAATLAMTSDTNGMIQLVIPQGEHRIAVDLERSASERAGLWISGIALLIAGAVYALSVLHPKPLFVRKSLSA
jgi:hypothetical protein